MGPFVITAAVQLWYFDDFPDDDSDVFSVIIASNLTMIHQILCPILILTSYKECRFHLAVLCLCCCKDKKQNIERDYKQYYATFIIAPENRAQEDETGLSHFRESKIYRKETLRQFKYM